MNNLNPFPNFSQPGANNSTPTFNNGANNSAPTFNNGANNSAPTFNNATANNSAPSFNNGANNSAPTFNNGEQWNNESVERNEEFEKDEKLLYHERNKIIKFATNSTFFEVLSYNFKRGTIVINMQNYKQNTGAVKISLKFSEFLYLEHLITTGQIFQMNPDQYGNLYKFQKGTGAKYNNGNVVARHLSFQKSQNPDRYPIVFVATEGPGKQDNRGLIQFAGAPTTRVIFPMTSEMLVEFFGMIKLHLNGYMAACYQHKLTNNHFFTKN